MTAAPPWTYSERAAAGVLRRDVATTYAYTLRGPGPPTEHRIVAHAVVDVMWRPGGDVYVGGAETAARSILIDSGSTIYGVRCRPGHASVFLGMPASELTDRRLSLEQLWGTDADRLADAMNSARSAQEGFALLGAALARRAASAEPDPTVGPAVAWLERSRHAAVAELSDFLGISPRQFRRRFTAAVGVSPQTYHGIARVRRFLSLAGRRPAAERALDALALEAGYADQAHLSREFRRFTGLSPSRHVVNPGSWG